MKLKSPVLPKRQGFDKAENRVGLLFILPFIIGFVFIYADIIVNSIAYSFTKTNGLELQSFAGLQNYAWVLFYHKSFNVDVLMNLSTLVVNVPVIIIFSLFIASVLNQKMLGRGFFRIIFFVPVILVAGVVEAADNNNYMLSVLSTSINTGIVTDQVSIDQVYQTIQNLYLPESLTVFLTGLVNNVYGLINSSGVQILVFIAGLQSISPSIYESVQIEGASGWDSFWKITFPMIMPLILVNTMYTVIDYFTKSTNVVMKDIKDIMLTKLGEASAMAWLYFLALAVLLSVGTFVILRLTKKVRS